MKNFDQSKFISERDAHALESMLKARLKTDPRDATMLLTAYRTGMRAQELLNLKWNDVSFSDKSINVKTIKRGNTRDIPVDTTVINALKSIRGDASDDAPIFGISYKRLWQVWQTWRPIKKKFHSLRHTFALRVLKKSNNILLVKYLLGHKDLNETMTYVSYTTTVKDIRKYL